MNETRVTKPVRIEGAKLIFKNFQGKQSDYNAAGNRNFGVLLDDELAEELKNEGWNVKYRKPREDDPDQYYQPWLPVKVKFGDIPPMIVLVKSNGKRRLTEKSVDQLDWSILENVDLIIRPYNYPAIAGRPAGVSAYLREMYAVLVEDDFAKKYADYPDLDEE